jgi:pepF/M3 family oligoendopeptidase|eukprot:CAMPEP_0174330504 /NCGR_PEP_ID=MMETSP0810-20121108/16733_1 /TAXON_ID=73025 ORGANISM="Eutreptiella gymnastica-like, Strain CCMP1594" /NCGR_SAMPLE_ID=MMETSP0810 /ASSEMBLY_ACC=CAM_ASM_000659 /LENGTH=620 /DNA_ID=CAMNT_0015445717 /DNA_START=17 /DNA_END=1879 /DNA_ORIENTATION=-
MAPTIDTASLPRWDLSKFGFSSPFSEDIDSHLAETRKLAEAFKAKYEGKLSELSLLSAIEEYEQISIRRTLVSSYLHLSYDTALEDDDLKKRKGALSQTQSEIYGDNLEWFSLDVAELDDADLTKQYGAEPNLSKYKSFIDELRRQKPHNLSKDVERALTVRAPYAGTRPLVSFFDKELSLMRFKIDGEDGDEVNMEVLLSRMSSSSDAAFRAKCLKALNDSLAGSVSRTAALSLSAVSGSWLIENKERKYVNLRSRRNLDNNCPDEVVDSLLDAVRKAGLPLCKRYYGLKKAILQKTQGLEKLKWSDRNAPIDIGGSTSDKISWEDAVAMVEKGYHKFSPKMADLFKSMVDEKRIDVPATNGKKGGAYCAGAVPGVGPFQLLNFDGTKQDVATLAHESGHGCHDILAYSQGYLQYHPPLTLAETASIFGEMIVFRDLLSQSSSKEEELTLLMSKTDDILNSVVRQCSFDRFEELVHTAREKGELSADEMVKYWMQALREYYGTEADDGGDSPFDSYDDASHLWSYVPHFHHVPFYVYSYAFADLVVGTLYNNYVQNREGFEGRLIDLLSAGGTKDFADALAPFGLDPTSPTFWIDALNAHLGELVNEAEKVAKELGYVQ